MSCSLTNLQFASHMLLALCVQDGETWAVWIIMVGCAEKRGREITFVVRRRMARRLHDLLKPHVETFKPARVPDRPALVLEKKDWC